MYVVMRRARSEGPGAQAVLGAAGSVGEFLPEPVPLLSPVERALGGGGSWLQHRVLLSHHWPELPEFSYLCGVRKGWAVSRCVLFPFFSELT